MKLILDMGNTRLRWAVSGPGQWQVGTPMVLGPELAASLSGHWGVLDVPESVWLSAVCDAATIQQVTDWLVANWSIVPTQIQASKNAAGVTNCYPEPATLGSDRWAALAAVRNGYRLPACIVDCGTAVTIDAIDEAGRFRGGVILPGLGLMRRSLSQGTVQVGSDRGDSGNCLSCSTADGMAAGTLAGLAGAIDRIIALQCHELAPDVTVYLTGGDADELLPSLETPVEVVQDLVLQGVRVLSERPA